MPESTNVYAPPKARVEDVVPFAGEAHEVRTEHIQTETSIRAIGTRYYLGGGLLCVAGIAVFMASRGRSPNAADISMAALEAICLGGGVLSLVVARGLRKLRPWARIVALILAGLGVLSAFAARGAAPVGALINAYILYLLLCKKGRRIFESDYPDIVAATPDVKGKTSIVVWIALALLLLVLVGIIAAAVLSKH
jgi:hypothetical protein